MSSINEEQQLLLQEALLVQELSLIRAKLHYVRLLKSEQQRGSSSSSSQENEEHVGASSTEPQRVNTVPSPSKEKTISIPEQTATGKESTNPLIVDSLLKTVTEVQTSTTLVSPLDFSLRPNGGIQIPKKTEEQSSAAVKTDQGIQIPNKNSKPYYVVYNGPNAGIFDNWELAKAASNGIPDIKHKKFKNFLEAKTSANIYRREMMLPELSLISSAEGLNPNTFCEALKTKKSKQVHLGRLPVQNRKKKEPEENLDSSEEISLDGYQYMYTHARLADEQKFVEERYFTTDSANLSFYNFCRNADPVQVYEAFQYGLVKCIYPSPNLQELKLFPKTINTAIKNFRTKCLKNPDVDIFLKINSSGPCWGKDGDLIYSPHHLIQIGVSKGEAYHPIKNMECKLEENDLLPLAKRRLEAFVERLFAFSGEDKIFVNNSNDKILIYSKSLKPISIEDEKKFVTFQNCLLKTRLLGDHYSDICAILQRQAERFDCKLCKKQKEECTQDKKSSKGQ